MNLKSRHKISVADVQFRHRRPDSKKLIFISCEGLVTEEEYFKFLSENIFEQITSKIKIISVREDFNSINSNYRLQEDIDDQNKSTPRQVMERIDKFREQKKDLYKFEQNPEDEFWMVIDVDDHTDEHHISEWEKVMEECNQKKYNYAISNPFFEFWLYMHHLEVRDEDYDYAVTNTHPYEKTSYFVDEMKKVGVKMTGNGSKKPHLEDYSLEKIEKAIESAKKIHKDEKWPNSLGSTVYLLVEKMIDMVI